MAYPDHQPPPRPPGGGLTSEVVAVLASAAGLRVDPERLPDVAAVLSELLALETALDGLDLSGIDPDAIDPAPPEPSP